MASSWGPHAHEAHEAHVVGHLATHIAQPLTIPDIEVPSAIPDIDPPIADIDSTSRAVIHDATAVRTASRATIITVGPVAGSR